mmetsp:Transcript_102232/g.243779  ORF Transcript_102232/g.243779 Transcript_102232/m.243779 type:complete len:326 (+) Transcript_102232:564-1541(+)
MCAHGGDAHRAENLLWRRVDRPTAVALAAPHVFREPRRQPHRPDRDPAILAERPVRAFPAHRLLLARGAADTAFSDLQVRAIFRHGPRIGPHALEEHEHGRHLVRAHHNHRADRGVPPTGVRIAAGGGRLSKRPAGVVLDLLQADLHEGHSAPRRGGEVILGYHGAGDHSDPERGALDRPHRPDQADLLRGVYPGGERPRAPQADGGRAAAPHRVRGPGIQLWGGLRLSARGGWPGSFAGEGAHSHPEGKGGGERASGAALGREGPSRQGASPRRLGPVQSDDGVRGDGGFATGAPGIADLWHGRYGLLDGAHRHLWQPGAGCAL